MPRGLLDDRVAAYPPDALRPAVGSAMVTDGSIRPCVEMFDDDLAGAVVLAGHLLETRLDQALRPEGLTARQLRALRYIAATPDVTRAELAAILCTSKQAAGGIAQRLHAIRLVGRKGDGPGFPVTFRITAAGRRCLARAGAIVVDTEREVTAQLSSTSLKSFAGLLHELIVAVR